MFQDGVFKVVVAGAPVFLPCVLKYHVPRHAVQGNQHLHYLALHCQNHLLKKRLELPLMHFVHLFFLSSLALSVPNFLQVHYAHYAKVVHLYIFILHEVPIDKYLCHWEVCTVC